MALKDDVTAAFARLAPAWSDIFRRVGLAFPPHDLAALQIPLARIDRGVPGFEDFSPQATRAIEPGDPALSLIYHALASPAVHPSGDGSPAADDAYATLAELDLLESYIYSLKPVDLAGIDDLAVAVFAYEYRPASATSHHTHADLMFSRTGVARIGSQPMAWCAPSRCFLNQAQNHPGTFAVMPARFGVFLARKVKASRANISVVGQWQSDDDGREFLLPVHKLFDGPECLAGCDLAVAVKEYHRAEKLHRLIKIGDVKLRDGFNVDAPPFVRESGQEEPLVRVDRIGSGGSFLVSSPPAELVRYATQTNALSGRKETASFEVPGSGIFFNAFAINRHYTTLMLVESWWTLAPELLIGSISDAHPRIAPRNVPNFVNIRHEVRDPAKPPVDLNEPGAIPADATYEDYIAHGRYQAAMFEDSICDGSLRAEVAGLPRAIETRAAFSIVAAPDFFAFADELQLNNHSDVVADQFSAGGPAPLCEGRYRVNPAVLRMTAGGGNSPDLDDHTLVAIVGRPKLPATSIQATRQRNARTTSYLTDAASNEFAPGWDVTFCGDLFDKFYATYGLGSPFPEDVKLCAAANSFWPAAAPDASRTFDRAATPTAVPMLDEELGYHPDNPDKPPTAGTQTGWDGEHGPFFEYLKTGERVVNVCNIWRSDYVHNARNGLFKPDPFLRIDSDELIARMECLRLCVKSLPEDPKEVRKTKLWLVTAQRVDDWAAVPSHHTLSGPGYKFVFVRPTSDDPMPIEGDFKRVHQKIHPTGYVCHVTPDLLWWSTDGSAFALARA